MGTSIGKVGFLGERNESVWCLTHIETLRYHKNELRNLNMYGDDFSVKSFSMAAGNLTNIKT